MMRSLFLLLPAALTAPLFAQKVELKVQGQDQPTHVSINTKFQTEETRKTLINGEENQFGGGRGGPQGGETSLTQEIVFDEGPANAGWREYKKLSAKETRPGQDGSPRETATEGALQGKKVFLKADKSGAMELTEGEGDKAKAVPAPMARGVPGPVSFAGFLPANEVAVGEEFDLSKTFVPALRGVVHPVTPDRSQDAGAGGQGGGRGQGGQGNGGGRGQGGQGGGRGPGGGGRMGGGGVGTTVTSLLSGGKLNSVATGKLIGVEEKDGQKIATVEFKAKLTGKGKAEDLGLQSGFGNFGGRGGRGAQGGQDAGQAAPAAPTNGTDNVDASFDVKGKVTVNLTKQQIASVELDGELTVGRETKRTMDRNGEEMKMDTTSNTKGKFQVQVHCEPVTAK